MIDAVLNRRFSQIDRVLVGRWVEAAVNLDGNVKNETGRNKITSEGKLIFSLSHWNFIH